MDEVIHDAPQTQTECIHNLLANALIPMLGLDGCSNSCLAYVPWYLIGLLYLSKVIRYRFYTFPRSYENRPRPTVYARLTYVFWEVIAAMLLAVMRLHWVLSILLNGIVYKDAWKHRDFSHWFSWGVIFSIITCEISEHRFIYKSLIKPYWDTKRRDAELVDVRTILLEGRQNSRSPNDPHQDVEKGCPVVIPRQEKSMGRLTLRQRVTNASKIKFPKPTTKNLLTQLHSFAFIKAAFAFIFLSDVCLSACRLEPKDLLNSQKSAVPALLVIGLFCFFRAIYLTIEGLTYIGEVDWDTLGK